MKKIIAAAVATAFVAPGILPVTSQSLVTKRSLGRKTTVQLH